MTAYHFRPEKGWINDPNGLVQFRGYYHIFYQHSPNFETPWHESMHWGHARTKDFIHFEELPVALFPDKDYDRDGCWSGTAIVKDDMLYLFYACVRDGKQAVAVACSSDGINFEKYEGNPVIASFPPDGSPDFRDPAVCFAQGKYWCVMASGNREKNTAVLLLYESEDLLHWKYNGIMREWQNAKFAECPSFVKLSDNYLLAASVCKEDSHCFSLAVGSFKNGRFISENESTLDRGPDRYAGQIFSDNKGRAILISWVPGWDYVGYKQRDIGCMSLPCEITYENKKLRAYPLFEVKQLLSESDPAIKRTPDGFCIKRKGREEVVYKGEINNLKCLRDEEFLEVFVNGGEEIFTALL
ncbi:MAG: glycoside hydrolase family 32 protein [Eubacterium sp.]|nr:glycoside hydrolase family 32 protein [Eubacterium sp.]